MKTANCTATALVLSMIGQASVLSSPANAHAYLVDSYPSAKMHINKPLKTVRLRFSGRADAQYSTALLEREDGAVLAGQTQPKASTEIDFPVPPLQPGRYFVHYRVLSVDGDLVEGKVDFVVEQ